MENEPFYVKYAVKSLDEVIGNDELIRAVKRELKSRTSKVLILQGPDGCGKRTLARIMAETIVTGRLKQYENFLEFDVTNYSNEAIESLRNDFKYATRGAQVRVFKDIDLASKQFQNSLISLTEKAKNHYFIFLTTRPENLEQSFIDRCALNRYSLGLLSDAQIVNILNRVVLGEKRKDFKRDALYLIAKLSKGNPRNALDRLQNVWELSEIERNAVLHEEKESEDLSMLDKISAITLTGVDFQSEHIEKPKMLLSPWLTEGSVNMIYGWRGCGKTFLSMLIALALTREDAKGINIGNWQVEWPSGVLYLDGEMHQYYMQERLIKLRKAFALQYMKRDSEIYKLNIFSATRYHSQFKVGGGMNLNDESFRDGLTEYIQKQGNINLIILDNISSLTRGISENIKHIWDPVNEWLTSLRHINVATILIHHAGKGGAQRGTSGREDILDCVINLKIPTCYVSDMGAAFQIEYEKTRTIDPVSNLEPFGFKFFSDGDQIKWTSADFKDQKPQHVSVLIVGLLLEGKFAQKDIADLSGKTASWVSQMKTTCVNTGDLASDDTITEKGSERLREIKAQYGEDLEEAIRKYGEGESKKRRGKTKSQNLIN